MIVAPKMREAAANRVGGKAKWILRVLQTRPSGCYGNPSPRFALAGTGCGYRFTLNLVAFHPVIYETP